MYRIPVWPLEMVQARLAELRREAERERTSRALLLQERAEAGRRGRIAGWIARWRDRFEPPGDRTSARCDACCDADEATA